VDRESCTPFQGAVGKLWKGFILIGVGYSGLLITYSVAFKVRGAGGNRQGPQEECQSNLNLHLCFVSTSS
jgi:hypothetical protein